MNPKRDWTVLLIGGASGSGKSSISYPLARLFDINLVEVDDFQVLLQTMTKPEHLPAIHYWETHPEWQSEGVNATVNQLIDVGRELSSGLVAVINNHLESNIPVILEGDFILPELSASFTDPRIKSVFVHEPDKNRILLNYLEREKDEGPQHYRTEVSFSYGNWLVNECNRLGVPFIEARPWNNGLQRLMECIGVE